MKEYDLITTYPCLVKFKNEEFFLEENEGVTFENENIIYVFPISQSLPPFKVNLQKLSKNYTIFDKNYEKSVILLNIPQKSMIKNYEIINFSNAECKIKISQESISFAFKNNEVEIELDDSFDNYKVYKNGDFALLHIMSKNLENLFCYNTKSYKLFKICGNSISYSDDIIVVNERINSNITKDKQSTYKIKNSEIVLEEEKFYSVQDYNLHNEKIVPFVFLDCVKIRDYESARNLLSDNLKSNITKEHLVKYFGKIRSFIPLSEFEYIVVNMEKTEIFIFTVSNGKISDIESK